MTRNELLQSLNDVGWTFSRDEAGDLVGSFWIQGRSVQIIPGRSKLSNGYEIVLLPSVSTENFSQAVSEVAAESCGHTPIVKKEDSYELYPELTSLIVQSKAAEVLAWAQEVDIEAGLKRYRDLPTDAPGSFPLWHLGALAIAGEVERLQGYQDSFRRGDRLGFVPYIKEDMIDRALRLAKRQRADI